MSTQNLIVASLADPEIAGKILGDLRQAGFDMHKWSLVTHRTGEIPGEPPEIRHGVDLRDLDETPYRCIPNERRPDYQNELGGNRLLLVTQGSPDEVDAARQIINHAHPCSWDAKVAAAVYYGCGD